MQTSKQHYCLQLIPEVSFRDEDEDEGVVIMGQQVDPTVQAALERLADVKDVRARMEAASMHIHKQRLLPPVYTHLTVPDVDELEVAALFRMITHRVNQGMTKHVNDLLIEDSEQTFFELKEAIKASRASQTQVAIAQQLNQIEELSKTYPLVSAKSAANLRGDIGVKNASRTINLAHSENQLFVFYFGNGKTAQVPTFQFDLENLGVYEVVPRLCEILSGLNDWAVYKWFATHSEDLGYTPAEALKHSESWSDLKYLAGIFKSTSTLRDLSYTAEDRNG